MLLSLTKPVRRNSPSEEWDIRQLKKVLNRLGYYAPDAQVGINGLPDQKLFAGLTQYQKDRGLKPTDTITPDGNTLQRLNSDLAQTPDGYYVWRIVEDGKARNSHMAYNRTVRAWADSPDPGEDFNCRCWAEPVEPGLRPVYPELFLLPVLKAGKIVSLIRLFTLSRKKQDYTDHGNVRISERNITDKEIREAIQSAIKTGNVKVKIGKYGTPQKVYSGQNGITVIQETQGRNAGKIITTWRTRK